MNVVFAVEKGNTSLVCAVTKQRSACIMKLCCDLDSSSLSNIAYIVWSCRFDEIGSMLTLLCIDNVPKKMIKFHHY